MPLQRKVSRRKLSKRKVSKRKVSKRKTFRRKSTRVHKQKRRNTKRVKLRGGNGYETDVDSPKKRPRTWVPMHTIPDTSCKEHLKTEYKNAQDLLTTQVGINSRRQNKKPTCEDHLTSLREINSIFKNAVDEQLVWKVRHDAAL